MVEAILLRNRGRITNKAQREVVFSPPATGWKSAQRFNVGSCRGIGFTPDAAGRFLCMKIEFTVYGNLYRIEVQFRCWEGTANRYLGRRCCG